MKEDKPLPLGTRIFVLGEDCGLGTYAGFRETKEEHTIEFAGGRTKQLKLKEMRWVVKQDEVDKLQVSK